VKRSPMPRRRTPLRAIKPLRRVAARGKRDHYAHLRALVHAREGGCCARCGVHAPLTVGTVHHRRKQSQGGKDTPENCVWTCYPCNGGWIEDNPTEATRLGWTVPNGADPASWPVLRTHYGRRGWWQPSESGWTEATPDERQEVA
jgi:hypothetical protein